MSNYTVDYNDERFKQVESEKQNALTENNKLYNDMVAQSDSYYNAQIEASKNWAAEQQKIQQEQTDFTIDQIEQQKEQAKKDYAAEQSASYVDYQKQSNKFGVEAEQMAASGLANTGFSESSKVNMYTSYQNRIASARQSYNQAVLNYDNNIKQAQLQNSSALAEIAYTALEQQLNLSLEGYQYKNQLLAEREANNQNINNTYYGRYQDVLNQINYENEAREALRRYEEERLLEQQRYEEQQRIEQERYEQEMALERERLSLQQQQWAYEKEQAEIKRAQEEAAIKKAEEEAAKQTAAQSEAKSGTDTAAPTSIEGYGELKRTNETYYIEGIDAPIYTTNDGTWWWWDWRNRKWKSLGKNPKKPSAVKQQEVVSNTVGTPGIHTNNNNSTTVLPQASKQEVAVGLGQAIMNSVMGAFGFGSNKKK